MDFFPAANADPAAAREQQARMNRPQQAALSCVGHLSNDLVDETRRDFSPHLGGSGRSVSSKACMASHLAERARSHIDAYATIEASPIAAPCSGDFDVVIADGGTSITLQQQEKTR